MRDHLNQSEDKIYWKEKKLGMIHLTLSGLMAAIVAQETLNFESTITPLRKMDMVMKICQCLEHKNSI